MYIPTYSLFEVFFVNKVGSLNNIMGHFSSFVSHIIKGITNTCKMSTCHARGTMWVSAVTYVPGVQTARGGHGTYAPGDWGEVGMRTESREWVHGRVRDVLFVDKQICRYYLMRVWKGQLYKTTEYWRHACLIRISFTWILEWNYFRITHLWKWLNDFVFIC